MLASQSLSRFERTKSDALPQTNMNIRIADFISKLQVISPPPSESAARDYCADEPIPEGLPPPIYYFERFTAMPHEEHQHHGLKRSLSHPSLVIDGDIDESDVSTIQIKSWQRARTMPNLYSNRSMHNRNIGLGCVSLESEKGVAADRIKHLVDRVSEFDELLEGL